MGHDVGLSLGLAASYGYFVSSIVWGIHAVIFFRLLNFFRHGKAPSLWLRAVCIFGFVSNTIVLPLFLFHFYSFFAVGFSAYSRTEKYPQVQSWLSWLYYLSIATSDSVQVWRCITLWDNNLRLAIPLLILLSITIIAGLVDYIANSVVVYSGGWSFNSSGFAVHALMHSVCDAIWLAASILTNYIAMALIVIRIKTVTRTMRADDDDDRRRLRPYQWLMAVIIECGIIYTGPALAYLTTVLVSRYDEGTNSPAYIAAVFLSPLTTLLAGLYPTSLILFSEVVRSKFSNYPTMNTATWGAREMQFHQASDSQSAPTTAAQTSSLTTRSTLFARGGDDAFGDDMQHVTMTDLSRNGNDSVNLKTKVSPPSDHDPSGNHVTFPLPKEEV